MQKRIDSPKEEIQHIIIVFKSRKKLYLYETLMSSYIFSLNTLSLGVQK